MEKPTLNISSYSGGKSTLCTGCGHDSVTQHIITAFHKSQISPFEVVKISGIGCSSKTPAYFMNQSHGFNTIHGRMASVATGAKIANRNLKVIGISGDGDTASIGLGGFMHLLRRNVPMIYIVENNGVYGLTKGQFSATADLESENKEHDKNIFASIDLCALAIEADCEFVARSFSGDGKQLVALIQAAAAHNGTAFIDVISPCITYANNQGSTKSYDYVKEHKVQLQELGFISAKEETKVDYAEGETIYVQMADGQYISLKKISHSEHSVNDRMSALKLLHESREQKRIVTGLIYHRKSHSSLPDKLSLTSEVLIKLNQSDLNLSANQLKLVMERYK